MLTGGWTRRRADGAQSRVRERSGRFRMRLCSNKRWWTSQSLPARSCGLLAHDHDAAVAFAALSTTAILERALLEHLQGSQNSRDSNRYWEITAKLAEVLGEQDPLSSRYRVVPSDGFQYADARLTALTEFITGALPLIPYLTDPSHEDLDVAKKTLGELCNGLDSKKFSDFAQQKFVRSFEEYPGASGGCIFKR
ncbi:hypothetical protein H4582DRAFT_700327 [Lactarius indigo]|nr:hypothetical protein H4582DRAFT_700327 [Lactarius indigo]